MRGEHGRSIRLEQARKYPEFTVFLTVITPDAACVPVFPLIARVLDPREELIDLVDIIGQLYAVIRKILDFSLNNKAPGISPRSPVLWLGYLNLVFQNHCNCNGLSVSIL